MPAVSDISDRTSENRAFEALVRQYRRPLAAAAFHLCGDPEAAQDIVQETFVDAYRGFATLRDPDRAGAWLYAILRRKALSHRRARRNDASLTPDLTAPGLTAPGPDSGEALVAGIVLEQMGRLSAEDREVLAGKYLLGLSYQEIGEALGIAENAVAVRCFRAKQRLREALHGAGIEVPEKHRGTSERTGGNGHAL